MEARSVHSFPQLLSRVRVLDFTRVLAGPYLTRCLAALGAEVIKVERPVSGDDARGFAYHTQGESGYFLQQNHDKKSIALDLKHPKGAAIARELCARADVVVENFRPGVMTRLGLDYATLSARHPRLIMCSISTFGQTGPYAQKGGQGMLADALSGAMDITGFPDRPPPVFRLPVADILTGVHGLGAICAALYAREQTGRGAYIDLSLLDCMFALQEFAVQSYFLSQGTVKATREGYTFPETVPYGLFSARDGAVVLAAGLDANWARLAQAMGRPELAQDPRFATSPQRIHHRREVESLVQEWIGQQTVKEVTATLDAHGVPCAPVKTVEEAIHDPQIQARHMLVTMTHPLLRAVTFPNLPFKIDGAVPTPSALAPRIGQHNAEVLSHLLG
ncbi:MAG: CoA transferase, partial [Nitrospinota bacterium]